MHQDSILLYGRDKQLLDIRQLLLRGSGYRVWTATNLAQIDDLSHVETIDLLLLCHSLSLEECERALAYSRSRWPFINTLVLYVVGSWSVAGAPSRVFYSTLGPEKLLATLGQLLDHQSSSRSHLEKPRQGRSSQGAPASGSGSPRPTSFSLTLRTTPGRALLRSVAATDYDEIHPGARLIALSSTALSQISKVLEEGFGTLPETSNVWVCHAALP